MRGHLAVAACATLFVVSPAAFAADPLTPQAFEERFYLSAHGGWIFDSLTDTTSTDTDPTTGVGAPGFGPTITSQSKAKPGYRFGAAIGKRFGGMFAVEGEVAFLNADADSVSVKTINGAPVGPNSTALTGSGSTWTGMVNAIINAPGMIVSPYVGAGAGVAYFTANNIMGGGAVLNGSDLGLAYQLIAGIDFAATQNTSIGARYRYLTVTDLSLMDGGYRHDFTTRAQSVEVVLTHRIGN